MLIRIVTMSIKNDCFTSFEVAFDQVREAIAAFDGCLEVRMLKGLDNPGIYTTVSKWTGRKALEHYRESELFRSTWSTVKPMFSGRAHAESYRELTS